MIAKVIHNGSVYYSPVFAVSMKYPRPKAVIFDSSFSKLIIVDVFKNSQYMVLFMDYEAEHFFINEESYKSYWNDRNIFRTIKNKRYTPKMLEEARDILHQMRPQEFTDIQSPSDIEALEMNTGAFHDGYILGIREQEDKLEILFDTSWGSLIILRCKGVIENTLKEGSIFDYCDMRIDEDGSIEFSFEQQFCEEEVVIKAREAQFKPLFQKQISIKQFDYSVSSDSLTIRCEHLTYQIGKGTNHILDFSGRNVLGYLQNDDIMVRGLIFCDHFVFSFRKCIYNAKKQTKEVGIIRRFQEVCEESGFCFDKFPLEDTDYEVSEPDYGEVIFSQEYTKAYGLLYMWSYAMPVLLVNCLFWLSIQLLNPQMKWLIFWIFGPGISLVVFLIATIAYVCTDGGFPKDNVRKHLEILENGIRYYGYNVGFHFPYEQIDKVEYRKGRITIYSSSCKWSLHRSKQDMHICNLLQEKLGKK